jgi:hypothetical protein
MSDSGKQNEVRNVDPAAEWAERLVRRATAPVGVINVKHTERLNVRTAGWINDRFGVLADWETRYGLQSRPAEAEAPSSGRTTFAEPLAALPNSAPFPSGPPTAPPAGAAVRTAVDSPDSSPRGVRVKRPHSIAEPQIASAVPATTIVRAPSAAPVKAESKAPSGDSQIGATPTVLRVQRKPITETQISASRPSAVPLELSPVANPSPLVHRAAGTPLQNVSEAPVSGELATAPEPPRTPTSSPTEIPLTSAPGAHVQRKTAELPQAIESAPPVATTGSSLPVVSGRREERVGPSPIASISPATVTAPSAVQVVARQVSSERPAAAGPLPSAFSAALPDRPASTVSREIRSAPLSPTAVTMVWPKLKDAAAASSAPRKAPVVTGSTYTAGPQVMRALGVQDIVGDSQAVAPSNTGGGEVNVTRLAEQVSRILSREMVIERERRGSR